MKIRIRRYRPDTDEAFVVSSWLGTWRDSLGRPRGGPREGRELVERVLSNPRTRVDVAVDADDDTAIVGYCCSTGDVLHFVLVKRDYRESGAARALVSPGPWRVWWPHPNARWIERCAALTFDPLALLDV